MKYSVIFKFLAILICVAALMGIAASGIGMLGLGSAGLLNDKPLEEAYAQEHQMRMGFTAETLAENWASTALGGVPEEITDSMSRDTLSNYFRDGSVYYTITGKDGQELFSNYSGQEVAVTEEFSVDSLHYQILVEPTAEEAPDETEFSIDEDVSTASSAYEAPEAEAAMAMDAPSEYIWSNEVWTGSGRYSYSFTDGTAPGCKITLYLEKDAIEPDEEWPLLQLLVQYRSKLLGILIASGLVFAAMAVYLCVSAGHRPGSEEVKPGGLNGIPLDLYGGIVLGYLVFCALLLDEVARSLLEAGLQSFLLCLGLLAFFGCLIFVGFCFACAAQFKMKDWYWLKNSLCGKCCRLILAVFFRLIPIGRKALLWCWKLIGHVVSLCIAMIRWGWELVLKLLRWCSRKLSRFFDLLPLTWQWVVGGSAIVILTLLAIVWESALLYLLAAALIFYAAYCFGNLLEAAKKMRQGALETKIDDKHMVGCFKDFAGELNGLADVAVVAAQKQLKSERMKTELITNVSHDIKTPLTSIINYVDLLQKPHTEEQKNTYLEVLSRQSKALKKLIEDLIEMSKATTGNIPVEIVPVDAVEAVNQALGEYSGKLEAAGLTPVFRHSSDCIMMLADGRLAWRAMSNLLSNAVKYALPGTRLYVDVSELDSTVIISLKNISRSELNISADELMERFVRGDTSRNTEGSGLGLNIAKSLMELQKGQLNLLVDGDLFKVTMVFPKG